jgi:DNA-binding MarR family transcriptional regulator
MEKNQLVLRVKDPKDRRVVRIHLLQEGERIIEEVIAKRQHYLKDMLVTFEEKELSILEKSLIKLQHEMREE